MGRLKCWWRTWWGDGGRYKFGRGEEAESDGQEKRDLDITSFLWQFQTLPVLKLVVLETMRDEQNIEHFFER